MISEVAKVRSKQSVKAIIGFFTWIQRREANFLQNDVAVRISENFFLDAILSTEFRIHQTESGDSGLDRGNLEFAMAFFFREKTFAVCD